VLEATPQLAPANWSGIQTSPGGGTLTFTIPFITTNAQQFFRIRVQRSRRRLQSLFAAVMIGRQLGRDKCLELVKLISGRELRALRQDRPQPCASRRMGFEIHQPADPVNGGLFLSAGRGFWRGCRGACLFAAVVLVGPLASAVDLSNVVIIKADDFRGPNQAWTNFLKVSRAAGVKVSIGVIASFVHEDGFVGGWMKGQEEHGDVEFWDHGWDHKEWTTNGQTVSEFQGSGLAHQREHLARAQARLKALLGRDVSTLGTPYNGCDSDTATVIAETPELRLLFTHKVAAVKNLPADHVAVLDIISESDGTAKPNAAKFEAAFEKRPPGPVSLQFHPPYFDAAHLDEYKKIVIWLKARGCQIVLPSEYLLMISTNSLPRSPAGLR
jgi:peptidoglycan/xylan/chitin deacetylase (PgdA/CDA1 family)